jgi:hypothetical protein
MTKSSLTTGISSLGVRSSSKISGGGVLIAVKRDLILMLTCSPRGMACVSNMSACGSSVGVANILITYLPFI